MKQIRPSTVVLSIALFALLFAASGCTGLKAFSDVIEKADTANKQIDFEAHGLNVDVRYHSHPVHQNTNAPFISAPGVSSDFSITPTYKIEQKKNP